MITRTQQGLVFKDDFNRASLGTDWTVLVSAGITSNRARSPSSGAASNRPGMRCVGASAALELFTQVEQLFTSVSNVNEPNHCHGDPAVGAPNYTEIDLHIGGDDTELYRVNAGTFTALQTGGSARSANTLYTTQLYSAAGIQEAAAARNGGLIDLRAGAYTGFDAIARAPVIHRNSTTSSSERIEADNFIWMKNKIIEVNAPPELPFDWGVRIIRADGLRAIHKMAVGGTCTIDCRRNGADSFGAWFPFDGFSRLHIVDDNGSRLDYFDDGEIYAGSIFDWDGVQERRYSLAVETAGRMVVDTFSGGNSPDVPGWTERSNNSQVISGVARVTGSNGTPGVLERTDASTTLAHKRLFVQANLSDPGGNPQWGGIVVKYASGQGYRVLYDDLFGGTTLVRVGGPTLDSGSGGGGFNPVELYAAEGVQEAIQGVHSLNGTDTALDNAIGTVALYVSANPAAGTVNLNFDNVLICRDKYLKVSDLVGTWPAGWKAKVYTTGGTLVRSATESGGVANLTLSQYDGTVVCPLAGWGYVLITDSADNPIELYDYWAEVYEAPYPGLHIYSFTPPPLEGDPPEPSVGSPGTPSRETIISSFTPGHVSILRFLRATKAWAFRERQFQELFRNQPAQEAPWIARELVRGPAVLVEPPSQQLAGAAAYDMEDAAWTADTGVSVTEVPSAFENQSAWLVEADGTDDDQAIRLALATNHSGNPEPVTFFLSGSGKVAAGIWDEDAADWALLVDFNMASGEPTIVAGAGQYGAELWRRFGIGYDVWALRLRASASSAGVRSAALFPAGVEQAAGTVRFHWLNWEPSGWGVNPLSPGMLAGGQLFSLDGPSPETSSWYHSTFLGMPSAGAGWLWHLGNLNGDPPYFGVRLDNGSIIAAHHNGTDEVEAEISGKTWTYGDQLRTVSTLFPGGATHLVVALRNEPPVQVELPSSDTELAAAWAGTLIVLGRGTSDQARCHHRSLIGLRAGHLAAIPSLSSPLDVMNEHERYSIRTDGLGDVV